MSSSIVARLNPGFDILMYPYFTSLKLYQNDFDSLLNYIFSSYDHTRWEISPLRRIANSKKAEVVIVIKLVRNRSHNEVIPADPATVKHCRIEYFRIIPKAASSHSERENVRLFADLNYRVRCRDLAFQSHEIYVCS